MQPEDFNQLAKVFNARRLEAQRRYPDFEAVLNESLEMPISDVMAHAILTSEFGHDIAYFLWKHLGIAAALYALGGSPMAVLAIAELELLVKEIRPRLAVTERVH